MLVAAGVLAALRASVGVAVADEVGVAEAVGATVPDRLRARFHASGVPNPVIASQAAPALYLPFVPLVMS